MDEINLARKIGEAVKRKPKTKKQLAALQILLDEAVAIDVLQSEEDFGEGWRLEDANGQSILPKAMRGLAFAEDLWAWHYWDAVGNPPKTRMLFIEFMEDIKYFVVVPEELIGRPL